MSGVSVIMPARNASSTIIPAAQSVLQSPEVTELIIINDGSTDDTVSRIGKLADTRIRLINGPERGISAALNVGFFAASSPFVARCDADDTYQPDRLSWQLNWLVENVEYVAISSAFRTVTERRKPIADLAIDCIAHDVTENLLCGEPVTHFCTWLTRTDSILAVGGAREWFVTAEDIDLMTRLAAMGRVWHDPRVGYNYTIWSQSITHTQANTLRLFYEQCSKDFALQRQSSGKDQLEVGSPPNVPSCPNEPAGTASSQIANQYVGLAWRYHKSGEIKEALTAIMAAIKLQPTNFILWKNFVALILKK